jgi:hypothetical protein
MNFETLRYLNKYFFKKNHILERDSENIYAVKKFWNLLLKDSLGFYRPRVLFFCLRAKLKCHLVLIVLARENIPDTCIKEE